MPRREELERIASRVLQCGPVTDYIGAGPDGLAVCVCAHDVEWSEGGAGGCPLCVPEAVQAIDRMRESY